MENTAYNNYHYKDGIRSNDTLVNSPTKIFILDVDKSTLDIYQMHNLLLEYRHHIATTSDKENLYKYRIIFELDREIEVNNRQWKRFYKSIGTMLQIPIDHNIAQSGIYFGYKDSIYMCNLDGIPLPTKDHLIQAYKEEEIRERIVRLKTSKQVDKAWDDRYELFESAYNAPIGSGSVSLYATMHTALERWVSLKTMSKSWWRTSTLVGKFP